MRYVTKRFTYCAAGLVCSFLMVLPAGCNFEPVAGQSGPSGPRGLDAGSDLPGTVVEILDVNDGDVVEVGDTVSVRFRLSTREGDPVSLDDIDRFSAYVSGSSFNYQRVLPPEGDIDRISTLDTGVYRYTFEAPFPAVYAPPPNDSPVFDQSDQELTGVPVSAGTHTVGLEARQSYMIDGATVRDAGDATFDFAAIGSSTIVHREVVIQENCAKCHDQLQLHGGNRFSVTGCVLCHVNGAEDLASDDPAAQTPDVTIQFANLIHRLHRGSELPTVQATANSADPFRYQVIGFQGSVHDYSDVKFPVMPGGTGFNEQVRNCGACHDGAAQGDEAYTNPRRATCGGCHDDIDWDAGTLLDDSNADVAAGLLTRDQLDDPTFRVFFAGNNLAHTFSDGECQGCHTSSSPSLDPRQVHLPPLANPANTLGLKVVVNSISGNTGAGFFQAGDVPVVEFQVLDRDDQPVDMADIASVNLVVSGPVDNYQRILPASGTTLSLKGQGGVPSSGNGPFAYTSAEPIPETYPPPFNDSADIEFASGWGELSGQVLVPGSYTAYVYATRTFDSGGVTYREPSEPGLGQFRIGSGGTAAAYAAPVSDTTCNACHGALAFHGNNRKGVAGCVTCHTAGAEDRPNPVAGQTQDPAPDLIDWKVMIHKIHAARELSVVQSGGVYDLIGFAAGQPADTGNVNDFSTGYLPTMPSGPAACTACHATESWTQPPERQNASIWMVVCTSCHDSASTALHVELNSAGVGQESCSTCHGPGAAFSVEQVHKLP